MATTSNTVGNSEPFTMDKLKAAMDLVRDLPPPPQFYSSKRYPSAKAFKLKLKDGAEAVLAHPAFWLRIPRAERPFDMNLLGGIQIIDLDDDARRDIAETIDAELAAALLKDHPHA